MRTHDTARWPLTALGAVMLVACGADPAPTDREPVDTGPHIATSAEVVSPQTFEVAAGDTAVFPVAIRVRDERGKPLPGAQVEWEGAIAPARMLTDTIGEARASWFVSGRSTSAAQAYARVVTTKGEVRIEFRATVKNGPLVAATVLRADTLPRNTGIVVEVGQSVRFTTYGPDGAGRYLRDVPATWSSEDPARATVDQNGVVTGRAQGFVRVHAAIAGLTGPVWGPVLVVDPLRASAIAVARGVSCAVEPSGSAVCWGAGHTPAVPSRDSVAEPVRVAPQLRFASLSSSDSDVCGLTTDGAAYCVGRTPPTRILPGVSMRLLATGSGLACGLDAAGAAFCQRGSEVQRIVAPVPFTAIAAGLANGCGAATDGVYCWSVDVAGRFTAATRVAGSTGATDLAMAGPYDVLCALDAAGAARCTSARFFQADSGWHAVLTSRPLARLALGEGATCAVSRDARLLCVALPAGVGVEATREIQAPDATGWRSVSFTDYVGSPSVFVPIFTHACGITGAGRTYCWGYNTSGQLGITNEPVCGNRPPYPCSSTPLPVPSPRAPAAVRSPD